ncbi:polyprenyl synthetase family protein [Chlamydiota bacterium]
MSIVTTIHKKIEIELANSLEKIEKKYSFTPLLSSLFMNTKHFILNSGKRIRPILFILIYKGLTQQKQNNLYNIAISLELLHNFILIHDDIVDNSDLRRGKPTMHKLFDSILKKKQSESIKGTDIALIIGDFLYAAALNTFIKTPLNPLKKDALLQNFSEVGMLTGTGEFLDLLYGTMPLKTLKKKDILTLYDLKTGYYSFTFPFTAAAILANSTDAQINLLSQYAALCGRAFQINNDIHDFTNSSLDDKKRFIEDIKNSKKTLFIWYTYFLANKKQQQSLDAILTKKQPTKKEIETVITIINETKTLSLIKREIIQLFDNARKISGKIGFRNDYSIILNSYIKSLLNRDKDYAHS